MKRPTGFGELDCILKGGIRQGSCIEIYGKPGVGKTFFSFYITKEYFSLLVDLEHGFSLGRYKEVFNKSPFMGISTPESIEQTKQIIMDNIGICDYIIVDSMAGVYENYEQFKSFMHGINYNISKSKTSLIMINQIRDVMYSNKTKRLGHKGLTQHYGLILNLEKKIKSKRGEEIHISIEKNNLSFSCIDKIIFEAI